MDIFLNSEKKGPFRRAGQCYMYIRRLSSRSNKLLKTFVSSVTYCLGEMHKISCCTVSIPSPFMGMGHSKDFSFQCHSLLTSPPQSSLKKSNAQISVIEGVRANLGMIFCQFFHILSRKIYLITYLGQDRQFDVL